jgi:hypothetical protein
MNVSARFKKRLKQSLISSRLVSFYHMPRALICLEPVVDFEESIVEDFAAGKLGITKITDCLAR